MRLIDADDFIEAMEYADADVIEDYGDSADFGFSIANIREVINKVDAVDAVPVVRCKDCKRRHWYQEPCHGKTVHVCSELGAEVTTDFFCAAGERRADR